jgi:hypothetical protein
VIWRPDFTASIGAKSLAVSTVTVVVTGTVADEMISRSSSTAPGRTRRVRTIRDLVAEPPGHRDEAGGARPGRGPADRVGLAGVETQHGRRQHPPVGVEHALHARRPDLPVRAGQRGGGRGDGGDQVVQQRL